MLHPASPLGGKIGTLGSECLILANSPANGVIKISAACAAPIAAEQGTLFVLLFNVLSSGGQTALSFRNPATEQNTFSFNDDVPPVKTSDGSLTVNAASSAGGSINGRVVGADNRPVFKAQVTLADRRGSVRCAVTNQFGYYRFADVSGGQEYVVSAAHRQHRFDAQTVSQSENLSEVNFINFTASESVSGDKP